jgi:hypothetical protein
LIVGEQDADADTDSEGDERGRDDGAGAGRSVDDGGIVLRHVNDLRIGRLNDVDGLAGDLLDFDLLLLIAAERSGGVGLGAEALDRGGHLCLIGRHGRPIATSRQAIDIFEARSLRSGPSKFAALFCAPSVRAACGFWLEASPFLEKYAFAAASADLGKERVGVKSNWR